MISMMSQPDANETKNDMPEANQPKYPYGLCITLNDESVETLGIKTLPEVGTTMMLTARVKVTSVSSRDTDDSDGPDRSIDLQITDMELGADQNKKNPEDVLYGKNGSGSGD